MSGGVGLKSLVLIGGTNRLGTNVIAGVQVRSQGIEYDAVLGTTRERRTHP